MGKLFISKSLIFVEALEKAWARDRNASKVQLLQNMRQLVISPADVQYFLPNKTDREVFRELQFSEPFCDFMDVLDSTTPNVWSSPENKIFPNSSLEEIRRIVDIMGILSVFNEIRLNVFAVISLRERRSP